MSIKIAFEFNNLNENQNYLMIQLSEKETWKRRQ